MSGNYLTEREDAEMKRAGVAQTSTSLLQECEECGTKLSPVEAEDSYHSTFKVGEGGSVLCGKHLDERLRQ